MRVDQPPATGRRSDGRQQRWDQHKAERRRMVLEAALEVVEEAGPGGEVHVHQVAERAGLSRPVLYRHFADRADLDRQIQAEIVDRVWGEIVPVLSLEGTPVQVIRRIVAAYVSWAAVHPALHRFMEIDVPGEGRPELVPEPEVFVDLPAQSIWQQIAGMAAARGAVIDPDVPLHEVFGGEPAGRSRQG